MDRVDMLITKPLPHFWSFLSFWKTFHDHMWTKQNSTILFGTLKTSKKEEDELVPKKKTLTPPYFQISYHPHFLFFWNNLQSYGSAIWNFTKPFWSAKTIEWRPKILSSRIQTNHMCQPTCPWPPSLGKNIPCWILHQFEQFLLP
jgi:hypothetical protein